MRKKTIFTAFLVSILLLAFSTAAYLQDTKEAEKAYPLVDGIIHEGEYSNYFHSEIGIEIFWEFGPERLYMALQSPISGWLAIGFEPSTRMNHAKIIMATFQDDELVLEEHIGTNPISHRKIEEVYISEFEGNNLEGLLVEFVIPLDEDSIYDIVEGEELAVILGSHRSSQNLFTKHTQRETIALIF